MKIFKTIISVFFLLLADLGVYIFLGIFLMGYEDMYNPAKGPVWSLESMNAFEKFIYISFELWNLINILAIVYILHQGYKFYKNYKRI